jgi:hypothetical protein
MEKKNKWRIAFWISVVLMVFVIYYSAKIYRESLTFYSFASDYYCLDLEFEREFLIEIINNTDLSKNEIAKKSNFYRVENDMLYKIYNDTLYFNTLKLVFENDKLQKIIKLDEYDYN